MHFCSLLASHPTLPHPPRMPYQWTCSLWPDWSGYSYSGIMLLIRVIQQFLLVFKFLCRHKHGWKCIIANFLTRYPASMARPTIRTQTMQQMHQHLHVHAQQLFFFTVPVEYFLVIGVLREMNLVTSLHISYPWWSRWVVKRWLHRISDPASQTRKDRFPWSFRKTQVEQTRS